MNDIPKISEAEWTVIQVVWKKHPITAGEIIEDLSGVTDWKPKTIKTLISRLVRKGALSFEKQGREYLYSPAVEEAAAVSAESESFLTRVFGGALNPMIAHFVDKADFSSEEIQELKKILEEKEKES